AIFYLTSDLPPMSKIFYFGPDSKVYGPVDELQAQSWNAAGVFSSDVRFKIAVSDLFEPKDRVFTLGELVECKCRTLTFYFSTATQKEKKELLTTLLQEEESLRVSCNERTSNGRKEDRE
ncbi:hypothetical protein PFISCL1PPCAC_25796, partial [Pristionchus fissidentatus]